LIILIEYLHTKVYFSYDRMLLLAPRPLLLFLPRPKIINYKTIQINKNIIILQKIYFIKKKKKKKKKRHPLNCILSLPLPLILLRLRI